ncbi:hypothetical protein EDF51_11412 [Curtobacterium sp. PhB25]|uniref:hypothetical protein n=1 Tax=Curtobacterium sp. PhB25 TaxID=2485205 RepID=UPI0010670D1D|nr:hypothetical protein [Curtobacterium sp. PhB25]TDW64181.1 hypothetical protein EDF51_11412 [Curtobacterium sp. PhB25]
MLLGELRGTIEFGHTLGTVPQLADDVRDGIRARLDHIDVVVSFEAEHFQTEDACFPSTCTIGLTFDDAGIESRRGAVALLIKVGQRVLDMIRVTQPVTGFPGALPEFKRVDFRVGGVPAELGFSWNDDYRRVAMIVRSRDTRPNAEHFLRAIHDDLNEDWDLDILIGQARHYAQNNWDSNPALALFLAALVAETKMKRVLWRDAPAELQDELLEVVPQDKQLQKQVQSLFSSLAMCFLGRSLKKERPGLWKDADWIFKRRNAFAHKGELVTRDDANRAVTWARNVALWADNDARQNYPH